MLTPLTRVPDDWPFLCTGGTLAHQHSPLPNVPGGKQPRPAAKGRYQYDVFVSYKREPAGHQLITPWLDKVLDRIEFGLRQHVGGKRVRMFIDRTEITGGDQWADKIRKALRTAKCLLPIWSPEYFRSDWCMIEWQSFVSREQLLKDNGHAACKLIVPIKVFDGQWFPKETKGIQQLDLSPYTATTEGFWETRRADELDQKLFNEVAPTLAKAVLGAPRFDPGWQVAPAKPGAPPKDVRMLRL